MKNIEEIPGLSPKEEKMDWEPHYAMFGELKSGDDFALRGADHRKISGNTAEELSPAGEGEVRGDRRRRDGLVLRERMT